MSFEKAKNHLQKLGLESKIYTFTNSSATVAEAANLLGCTDGEIAKSISLLVGDSPILVISRGDYKIDNNKFKSYFNTKAKMIQFDDVEKYIGHKAGGVCPFGINEDVKVYLDISLKDFDVLYPACGDAKSAVKLTILELEKASNFINWVDVCKAKLE